MVEKSENKPHINVTPFIDILLVLLEAISKIVSEQNEHTAQ